MISVCCVYTLRIKSEKEWQPRRWKKRTEAIFPRPVSWLGLECPLTVSINPHRAWPQIDRLGRAGIQIFSLKCKLPWIKILKTAAPEVSICKSVGQRIRFASGSYWYVIGWKFWVGCWRAVMVNEQACRHLSRLHSSKRGIPLHEQIAPVIFGSSRNAVISARVYQSQSVTEEMGRKMHAHPGSRRHQDLPFSN